MLREAERVVDHQMRAAEALDRKTERVIPLGVAALGAGVALAAVASRQVNLPVEPALALAILVPALLNVLALLWRLDAYLGFHH
jgi:hypothetical protein